MTAPYTEQAIPEDLPPFRQREAERLREKFHTDTLLDDGILRWKANNAVVPMHVFRDAFCTPSPEQSAAYHREADAFIADYRKRMANHVPDAEEMFEMRAAFGEGTTVVNVLTGKKTRL